MRRARTTKLTRTGARRLANAFAKMRLANLVARENFSCCGGCAGYEIASDYAKLVADDCDALVAGAVFYTKQDRERLRDTGRTYLAFGTIEPSELEPAVIGRPTAEVGVLATRCLAEAGVDFRWDGDPDRRIEVFPMGLPAVDRRT